MSVHGRFSNLSFLPEIPLENPGTIELIYLNPRNIRIPRYYRLSVSTGSNPAHVPFATMIMRCSTRFSTPCRIGRDFLLEPQGPKRLFQRLEQLSYSKNN